MNKLENYIVIDAARMEHAIHTAKELGSYYSCLYKGQSADDLENVAPYLFAFEKGSHFEKWYTENEWGNASGLLIRTDVSFEVLYKHLRKFLWVETEDAHDLYFRFYDPRVLPMFLEICNAQQLNEFFGPVENFICEDEEEKLGLFFSLKNNLLKTERISKKEIFS